MYPYFNSTLFMPQFKDHSWIYDRSTFGPDSRLLWENAALSMELSGLHNLYFNHNPYPQTDIGTLLGDFWNQAYKSANASLATMLGNFPTMPTTLFNPFNPVQNQELKEAPKVPAPKSDLTDEEKEAFEAKQTEFNNAISAFKDLDEATKKALGIDSAIAAANAAFAKADTPEKVDTCIKDLNAALVKAATKKTVSDLKSILPIKYQSAKGSQKLERKVAELYDENSDFDSVIYNLIAGETRVITSENVFEEMNTRQGDSCLIDEITHRYATKGRRWNKDRYKEVITKLVNAITERADNDTCCTQEVTDAVKVLSRAKNSYLSDMNKNQNREDLVKAYVKLYNAIMNAEIAAFDEKNTTFVKTLPEAYQERYLENDELKSEFKYPVKNIGFYSKENTQVVFSNEAASDVKQNALATNVNATTNPFANVVVDGETGADRIAKNMPNNRPVIRKTYGD